MAERDAAANARAATRPRYGQLPPAPSIPKAVIREEAIRHSTLGGVARTCGQFTTRNLSIQ